MCVTCTLILCISYYFLQPHCQKWVSVCCGWCSVPVVLVDQSGADLGLSLVRLGIYQKSSSTKLQCTFPILFPEKLSLAGRLAVRPIVCPSSRLGPQFRLVYLAVFSSPQAGVTLKWWWLHFDCFYTARLMAVV